MPNQYANQYSNQYANKYANQYTNQYANQFAYWVGLLGYCPNINLKFIYPEEIDNSCVTKPKPDSSVFFSS